MSSLGLLGANRFAALGDPDDEAPDGGGFGVQVGDVDAVPDADAHAVGAGSGAAGVRTAGLDTGAAGARTAGRTGQDVAAAGAPMRMTSRPTLAATPMASAHRSASQLRCASSP